MGRVERIKAEGILLTDMYKLTMAQLYFRLGMHETLVQFDHFFHISITSPSPIACGS
jgi:nicotinic acid phosphoribosyltransferase